MRRIWQFAILVAAAMAPEAQAATPPPEVSAYIKRLGDTCRQAGGKMESRDSELAVSGDLNGDGIDDWAINQGDVRCAGAFSLFSGSGGSQMTVFVGLPNGRARESYGQGMFGMTMERRGASAVLWLRVGGGYCGQSGTYNHAQAWSCERPLVWNKAKGQMELGPLSSVRNLRR